MPSPERRATMALFGPVDTPTGPKYGWIVTIGEDTHDSLPYYDSRTEARERGILFIQRVYGAATVITITRRRWHGNAVR